jgi:hypothetical protein
MARSPSARIFGAVSTIRDAYYKLVLAVGSPRSGKTAALSTLAAQHSWPRLNVNLRLSEQLLNLTQKQRATRVAAILVDMLDSEKTEVVILDNVEMLFAGELSQDPMRLLQSLSRNRTVIAAWPGAVEGTWLTYAEPGHPEARRYPTSRALVIDVRGDGNARTDLPGGDGA